MFLTVGEISKALGISVETIRHYVNEGLIKPKKNEENNYYYYSSEDFLRMTDVLFYRSMGLTIKEIKVIMDNLPLEKIGDIIRERRGELVKTIKECTDELHCLQTWDESYQDELDKIGKFWICTIPREYKHPGFIEDREHMAKCVKESIDIDKNDWGNLSLSFRININEDPPLINRYLAIDGDVKVTPGSTLVEEVAASEEKSICTQALDSDNIMELIYPIIDYAAENGYELTGEFYGHENTNYFIDDERWALYKVYGILKK